MKPTHIIVHCSDSTWGCAREINEWHVKRGWSGIGYHFVILNGLPETNKHIIALEGAIECGRDMDSEGAHCLGYNDRSLGICLIGNGAGSFKIDQFDSLKMLLLELCKMYGIPPENVLGHGETESGKAEGKTCPNFNVSDIRSYLRGRI